MTELRCLLTSRKSLTKFSSSKTRESYCRISQVVSKTYWVEYGRVEQTRVILHTQGNWLCKASSRVATRLSSSRNFCIIRPLLIRRFGLHYITKKSISLYLRKNYVKYLCAIYYVIIKPRKFFQFFVM